MPSGNPFRRPVAGLEPLRDSPSPVGDETRRVAPRVKKVQFVSPPQSPQESSYHAPFPDNLEDVEHSRSPPPQGLSFATIDPAALLRGQDVNTAIQVPNPQAPGGFQPISDFAQPSPIAATTASGAPVNPFARTLATLEPSRNTEDAVGKSTEAGRQSQGQQVAGGKPAMDVDAFAKMLLTGNSGLAQPAPEVPDAQVKGSLVQQPVLRQSLFEPVHQFQPQSPRLAESSPEQSESDEDNGDHTEHTSLMGGSRPPDPKPLPPKHKHGRLINPQGPQTVSFEEFDSSIPDPSSVLPQSPRISQITNGERPGLMRSSSDLNKPLPPPPPPESVSPDFELASGSGENGSLTPAVERKSMGDEYLAKKAPPPPPPVSRRAGPFRTPLPLVRTRANSSLNQTASPENENITSNAYSTGQPTGETGEAAGMERQAGTLPRQPHKFKPPPPPSRGIHRPTPPISRTPSQQSTSSAGNWRMSQNLSIAPPPPPPRRRDAKRISYDGTSVSPDARRMSNDSRGSSIDLRRASGQSFDAGRRDSISSLERVMEHDTPRSTRGGTTPKPADGFASTAPPRPDIMADLSAFQREVDALREREQTR